LFPIFFAVAGFRARRALSKASHHDTNPPHASTAGSDIPNVTVAKPTVPAISSSVGSPTSPTRMMVYHTSAGGATTANSVAPIAIISSPLHHHQRSPTGTATMATTPFGATLMSPTNTTNATTPSINNNNHHPISGVHVSVHGSHMTTTNKGGIPNATAIAHQRARDDRHRVVTRLTALALGGSLICFIQVWSSIIN
jgi:hypothetical protein